jgi:hypothetical protein
VVKFQVHAAAHILKLEHGTSPGGTGDGYMNWVRAKLRMAGKKSVVAAEKNRFVAVMQSLDVENRRGRKIAEEDAAFDFRLDDGVVDVVREIRMRGKHGRCWD